MKKSLSERDVCTKFITPAVRQAGWDVLSQIREEVSFTKGRIIVRGRLVTRGRAKRADYILYYKPNVPLALIEAKDNNYAVGDGMQQALEYATTLDIPFVFSSNGDAFLFHDRTGQSAQTETELPLDAFPAPANLWAKYRAWKGLAPEQEEVFLQDYFEDIRGKEPRYYQRIAINKAIEAIAKGQNRILLVMATGTGKDAIMAAYKEVGIDLPLTTSFAPFDDVPREVALLVYAASGSPKTWDELTEDEMRAKESKSKRMLCTRATKYMTKALLDEIDPEGDLLGWFGDMRALMAEEETPS